MFMGHPVCTFMYLCAFGTKELSNGKTCLKLFNVYPEIIHSLCNESYFNDITSARAELRNSNKSVIHLESTSLFSFLAFSESRVCDT